MQFQKVNEVNIKTVANVFLALKKKPDHQNGFVL